MTTLDRFLSKVDMPAQFGTCWFWRGAKSSNGYGSYQYRGRATTAHRIAYTLAYGSISPGLQIDHLCRNRACVNPLHLEAVTQQENIRRGNGGANNRDKTHCAKGHPYDEANTRWRHDRRGWRSRSCVICSREAVRISQMKRRRSLGVRPALHGTCLVGHIVEGENARPYRREGRVLYKCRICDNARSCNYQRRRRAKERAHDRSADR